MTANPKLNNFPLRERWRGVFQKKVKKRERPLPRLQCLLGKIWKERNAQIFNNKASTAFILIVKTKEEVALWSLAGAESLSNSNIMP
jgi:hypothetical protein